MHQHILDYGSDCLECHDGFDSMVRFNHRETEFPLDGQHIQEACADCHLKGNFKELASDCVSCHQEPELHRGLFDPQCSICHTTMAWSPAIIEGITFDHKKDTRFSLVRHEQDFQEAAITCLACHPPETQDITLNPCMQCHENNDAIFMDEHHSLFGSACIDCHDGVDRLSNFDHALVFPLDGRHAEATCDSCHGDRIFQGTPTECAQCHEEPQIHIGAFGTQCQSCHSTSAWAPARLTEHTFPLDHGESGLLSCDTCHVSTYIEYSCYECHEHQPTTIESEHREEGISLAELVDCAGCHPTGREEEGEHDD